MNEERHKLEPKPEQTREDSADDKLQPAAVDADGGEDGAGSEVSAPISRDGPKPGTQERLEKAQRALRMVTLSLPYLTQLAHAVQLRIDSRIDTAAVTPSGRVLFNPQFLDSLTLAEATMITAHELYHLALQTHERGEDADGWLVNIAHDLIINDILEAELRMTPPAGALRCFGTRHVSMERLLVGIRKRQQQNRLPATLWRTGKEKPAPQNEMERALDEAVTATESAAANLAPEPSLAGGLGPEKLIRAPDWSTIIRDRSQRSRNLDILLTVSRVAEYAHRECHLVHRDIKPQNVLVGEYREVYLVDWGLAVQVGMTQCSTNP